jgi:hypothetical protein
MELGKLLVIFFSVIIVLTILSLFPSKNQTGTFIISSPHLESAFTIIVFSSIVIFFVKVPKKYYRPIPSRG